MTGYPTGRAGSCCSTDKYEIQNRRRINSLTDANNIKSTTCLLEKLWQPMHTIKGAVSRSELPASRGNSFADAKRYCP